MLYKLFLVECVCPLVFKYEIWYGNASLNPKPNSSYNPGSNPIVNPNSKSCPNPNYNLRNEKE